MARGQAPAPCMCGGDVRVAEVPEVEIITRDLRQAVVVGNRDADESLWQAGIAPRRLASSLTADEVVRLDRAIQAVLDEGLRMRGTQRDLFGVQGQAKHRRNVFGRAGAPCPRCATPVSHQRIGGRNTYWCSSCQPLASAPEVPAQSSLL